ncbi:MAG: hypothetical protein IT293_02475 [Deltaproteobacteria bacterium]|nr:hypothetical protein [Deltaproteobacteria bacterium]
MAFIAFTLGTLTLVIGTIGVVVPSWIAALAIVLHGPFGLGLAAAVRLALGAALFMAAPQSRAPVAFRALGAVTFAAGILTPFMGVERFDALLDWWAALDPWLARTWSGCGAVVGGLIAYGIVPRDLR